MRYHGETRPEIQHCSAYRFTPYWKTLYRVNAPTFWIITPKVFIIRHLFQHSHVPKQIRNRTIPKNQKWFKNFLAIIDESIVCEGFPQRSETGEMHCYTVFHGQFFCKVIVIPCLPEVCATHTYVHLWYTWTRYMYMQVHMICTLQTQYGATHSCFYQTARSCYQWVLCSHIVKC